jgi:hypothetical protein
MKRNKPAKGKAVAVIVGGKKRSIGQAGKSLRNQEPLKAMHTARELRRLKNALSHPVLTTCLENDGNVPAQSRKNNRSMMCSEAPDYDSDSRFPRLLC